MKHILSISEGGVLAALILTADGFQFRWREVAVFFLALTFLAIRDLRRALENTKQ